FWIGAKPWGKNINDIGHKHKGSREQYNLHYEKPGKNLAREKPRPGETFGLKNSRIRWNIGGVESAFPKYGAKVIGQALGNGESVVEQPGAEHGGNQYVAQKSASAREQGQAADGEKTFVHSRPRLPGRQRGG